MYIGPSLNSRIRNHEGTTSWPPIWKTTEQREHHVAHNLMNDPDFRASQLEHDRDEVVCIKMDELAQKDFSHHMTQAEYFRYRRNWMTERLDH